MHFVTVDDVSIAADDSDESEETYGPTPFAGIGIAFRHSMDAVIELTAFADEHVASLDDIPAAIQQMAAQQLPNATPEQHAAATAAVIRAFEVPSEVLSGDTQAEADEAEDKPNVPSQIEILSAELEALFPNSASSSFRHYLMAYVMAMFRPKRGSVMYASLLTTAVGNYEVLVSGIVREFLRSKPEAIRSDEAKYSLAEIEGYESLEEFRGYCAERYAENLLRGSFEDWMDWFEKRLKIGMAAITSDPVRLREVFQRRHLIVHHGGAVNRLYLNKMADLESLPDMGERLTVDADYLSEAIDRLIAAGILLQVCVMRKLLSNDEDGEHPADKVAEKAVFDFLQQGRWRLAGHLAAATYEECASDYIRLILRVNNWIARKNTDGSESIKSEVESWQVESLAPRFRLAKFALLNQQAEAYQLGQELLESGEIDADQWWTWPLLAEVRAYEAEFTEAE